VGDAKQLIVKPIAARDANKIIKALHYSGKVVNNSQVHLGVFMNGRCGGALQFGPSLDKRKIQGLVCDTGWNEFIELNRMAFADWLPRNGESRCIGYAMRWLKKNYPWLKWVISFADGTQCGDGTIYRASGFVLTGIKKNSDLLVDEFGTVSHSLSQITGKNRFKLFQETKGASRSKGKPLIGFQLRYIYFLDQTARDRLTVPILPFSKIEEMGAGMYKGKPKRAVSIENDAPAIQQDEGGVIPTTALHE